MHRVIVITGIVIAGAFGMACGSSGTSEATSTTALTAASPRAQTDARSFEDRIATAVCVHEVECGRGQPTSCIDKARSRAQRELSGWTCDDAAARANAEQCLAGIRGESCSVDLTTRPNVCSLQSQCRSVTLNSPGAATAAVWRR